MRIKRQIALSVTIWLTFVLLGFTVQGNAMAAVTFSNLGVLPGGSESRGFALSPGGSAATGYSGSSTGDRAYIWTASGGMQGLEPTAGWTATVGCGFEYLPYTIVGFGIPPGGSNVIAFLWKSGIGTQALGTLPGGQFSYGNAISADGSIVVGESDSPSGSRAFRWTASGGMQSLGTLPGGTFSVANTISADGTAIAGYGNTASGTHAFRWTASGGMQSLGVLAGGTQSYGTAISSDGSVVVGYGDTSTGEHAFRWTASAGMQDLGTLPGSPDSHANSVNGDGSIVVGDATSGAFIWTPSRGMLDLKNYLTTLGVDLTNWTLYTGNGLNVDGTGIVGTGSFNGARRAWVATGVAPPPVPALSKSGLAIMLLLLIASASVLLRRQHA